MSYKDARKFSEDEDKARWKRGVQVSGFIPIDESLDHFKQQLKGFKTKIKEKVCGGKKVHAIFRYS